MYNSTLDDFCGSKFWDSYASWNTYTLPTLTPCFERTALVWVPCAFLWAAAPLELHYMRHSKERLVPWTWLNISKLVAAALMVLLALADLGAALYASAQGLAVYDVDFYTPIIKCFTFGLSATLVIYNRRFGLRASGVLFFFWLLLSLAGLPQLRTDIVTLVNYNRPGWAGAGPLSAATAVSALALAWLQLVLACFADAPPAVSPYTFDKAPCPESAAGFPSRLTFGWFDRLALKGSRRALTAADLWALSPADSSREVYPRFARLWERRLPTPSASSYPKASYSKNGASVTLAPPAGPGGAAGAAGGAGGAGRGASIVPALCLAFGGQFLFGAFLKLINDTLMFVSPQLLKLLIGFVNGDEPPWRGYLYAALLLACATAQTLLLAHYFTRMYVVGMRVRTALTAAVYRKALRLSSAARQRTTTGEIVNLMAVDAHRFLELMAYVNMVWSAPLQIALALYFLWGVLGAAVLAGLAVMLVLIPFNGLIASRAKTLQIRQMKYKDERVKLMNELLNGIKVLKMYAWEPSFEEQVKAIRSKEMAVLKQTAYLNSATSFIWSCAPFLVTFLTFFTYVMEGKPLDAAKVFVSVALFYTMQLPLGLLPLIIVSVVEVSLMSFACFVLTNAEQTLDSQRAFVALSLFNILRFPLSMLPNVISNLVQTSVGVKRLNKFMNAEELDESSVEHDPKEPHPLLMENCTFTWNAPAGDGDGEADTKRDEGATKRDEGATKRDEGVTKADESEAVATATLHDVSLAVPRGALVAVVGAVGSGKSSLLAAFLGEMQKVSGRANTWGRHALVSQQAWIQNATLQDNVLFGRALEPARYARALAVCALGPDLRQLPGEDQTEIGEKGINLSGGQKQRVALARAVYADADNYLLDDPLSAVDAHVGRHIFDKVIGPNGVLKHKTRVWVTHSVSQLAQADLVVVLAGGRVSEAGSYQQLLDKRGAFADYLLHHLTDNELRDNEELNVIKQELESKLGSEFQDKLQRARSLSESASETEPAGGDRARSESAHKALDAQAQADLKENNKLVETEKAETGSVKWSVYKHYLTSVGVAASALTVLMNLVLQLFQVGSNYWLALWSNDKNMTLPNGTVDASRRDLFLGVYGGLGIGQVLAVSVSSLALYLGALAAARALHDALLAGVLRAPAVGFFDCTPTGRVLNRFSKDVEVLDNVLPMTLRGWTSCFFAVVGTLFVICLSTPMFAWVIPPVGGVYYAIQRFYVSTSRQLKRLESVSRSPIYSHFGESLSGAAVIRAYGATQRFITESELGVDRNQECYYPSCIANRWLAVRLEMVGNLVIFLSALFAVMSARGGAALDAGLVGLSVSYALQITQTLNWLVRMTSDVETNIVAVERIKEYADTPPEAAWSVSPAPGADWPEAGALQLDNVTLAYRGRPALRDVTCCVRRGERVGIVGRTGAGKSTLTLGLFRIVEATAGRILIDGVDIASIGLHQLRSRITIIPQDPVLFSGSLRMNLDPFSAFTDDEVWAALEHAHLKDFVKGLPAGLRHEVAEGGENLSVGQRQLACLARALLRHTTLLVLDEATAAVDLHTDELIQKTIRSEFSSCTVLTIAHRLHTVLDSTRVMVLEQGRLAEFAPPQELLADPASLFYSMAKEAGVVS